MCSTKIQGEERGGYRGEITSKTDLLQISCMFSRWMFNVSHGLVKLANKLARCTVIVAKKELKSESANIKPLFQDSKA